MSESSKLMKKYDMPVPRYTSYPTVPYWSDSPTTDEWTNSLNKTFLNQQTGWSLYIHIPFCETLCTYCGCNTAITKNHKKEEPYVDLIHKEWSLYKESVPGLLTQPLKSIHLGGGTPTFLSPDNLRKLVARFTEDALIDAAEFEGSIEVHPNKTNKDHLAGLYDLGFRRLSLGVQDFDPEVQRLVNRIQPIEITENLTIEARKMGYNSINYDLIYGLPKQTMTGFGDSVDTTIRIRPDRIALYSLAKVPWIKPAQRLFKDEDLPEGEEKRALYEMARDKFLHAGYLEIGMDHFALPTDALSLAWNNKHLHRNFMGYTDQRTDVLLGLGVSSISETPECFHQNEKVFPIYERRVLAGEIPTLRGHLLDKEDQQHRSQILAFMTQNRVELESDDQSRDIKDFLASMIEDQLVSLEGRELLLTEKGKPFLRNACVALDARLRRKQPGTKIFSQSI